MRFFLVMLFALLLLAGCSGSTTPKPSLPKPSFEREGKQAFYQPQAGDTLASIAVHLGIDEGALRRFNPRSQEARLSQQRLLRLPANAAAAPASGPYTYLVQPGDTFSGLAQHFHISLLALLLSNPETSPKRLQIGQKLKIPVAAREELNYRWPVANPQISLGFSKQPWGLHQGLAFKTKEREEVFPIAPGQVVFAGEMRGYGRVVILQHPQDIQSIYAYCHALFIEEGNQLSGRHPVCSAGKQRRINTDGFHLELRQEGRAIPPENYLPALAW